MQTNTHKSSENAIHEKKNRTLHHMCRIMCALCGCYFPHIFFPLLVFTRILFCFWFVGADRFAFFHFHYHDPKCRNIYLMNAETKKETMNTKKIIASSKLLVCWPLLQLHCVCFFILFICSITRVLFVRMNHVTHMHTHTAVEVYVSKHSTSRKKKKQNLHRIADKMPQSCLFILFFFRKLTIIVPFVW